MNRRLKAKRRTAAYTRAVVAVRRASRDSGSAGSDATPPAEPAAKP